VAAKGRLRGSENTVVVTCIYVYRGRTAYRDFRALLGNRVSKSPDAGGQAPGGTICRRGQPVQVGLGHGLRALRRE